MSGNIRIGKGMAAFQNTAVNQKEILVKSSFVQVIQNRDRAVIWHSLFGNPQIVSNEVVELFDFFSRSNSLSSLTDEYDINEDGQRVIRGLIATCYLIPVNFDERGILSARMKDREAEVISGSQVDYLGLIMAEVCNFACVYCIHFSNLGTSDRVNSPQKIMAFETAKDAIDGYLSILRQHGKKTANINFGGGEPLLAWLIIERLLRYCQTEYGSEFEFKFSINTNASLITPAIAKRLKEHGVKVSSSLDGLREGNDLVRQTQSGRGTFDEITRGFDCLAEHGYPLDGIAVTINERNLPFLNEAIIDWAAAHHMGEVRIDIDVVGIIDISIDKIATRLMMVKRHAKKYGIEIAGFWSRPVENLNNSALISHVAFCGGARGNSLCVSPAGGIYSCGYSNIQIGSLDKMASLHEVGGEYHHFVLGHLTGNIEMCRGCAIEGQCNGGCNITHEFAGVNKTAKVERMCSFYRRMTTELLLEQLKDVGS